MIGDTISRTRRSPFKRFRPLILDSIPSTFVRKRPTITTRLEEQISILLYLLTCFIIIVCWEVCHCHVSIVIYLLCSQRPPIYRFITTRKWEEERSTKLLSNTWQSLSASAVTYHLHDSLYQEFPFCKKSGKRMTIVWQHRLKDVSQCCHCLLFVKP